MVPFLIKKNKKIVVFSFDFYSILGGGKQNRAQALYTNVFERFSLIFFLFFSV